MALATLTIDTDAIAANWRALDAHSGSGVETAATVKAGGYGLGIGPVARALAAAGARRFFVAVAEEGATLRQVLGEGPDIYVYGGHMQGDAAILRDARLVPLLNAPEQAARHFQALPGHRYGVQLDSGMNRLGMEPADWAALRPGLPAQAPDLVMSHLACADAPDSPENHRQLNAFRTMTADLGPGVRRSIAATGGVLLGRAWHFDLTRPGIGLYGGAPFARARPVVRLSIPVIQTRPVAPGEFVGYGCTWRATQPARIATLAAGYADGIIRAMGNRVQLYHGDVACPLRGRVSMDLLTVEITALDDPAPQALDLICPAQGIDAVADAAGTIGYEILTALSGARHARRHLGAVV